MHTWDAFELEPMGAKLYSLVVGSPNVAGRYTYASPSGAYYKVLACNSVRFQ